MSGEMSTAVPVFAPTGTDQPEIQDGEKHKMGRNTGWGEIQDGEKHRIGSRFPSALRQFRSKTQKLGLTVNLETFTCHFHC